MWPISSSRTRLVEKPSGCASNEASTSWVGLRGLPILNNLLGYFLGLVAWFAAHLEPGTQANLNSLDQ